MFVSFKMALWMTEKVNITEKQKVLKFRIYFLLKIKMEGK